MGKQENVKPFGIKDKIGYLFGDFGNDFTFIFASMFLMVFYTKVLGISSAAVGTLFLVARFVDAFTDVTMGRIVDTMKPGKDGKFRCWIRRMAGPVAIASFLMYQSAMAGAPMGLKMVYMYGTYLLWGSVFYTSINIPYGSMASALTSDPQGRTGLSTFRGIGATLASMIIGVLGPQLVYITDAEGNQIVQGGRITLIAGIFSISAILCYVICYFCTTERVKIEKPANEKKTSFIQLLATVFKSRPLLAIIGAAIGLLLSQLMASGLNMFLYGDYFKSKNAISILALVNSLVGILIVSPLVGPISKRFGKKESAAYVTCFSGIIYLILYFLRIKNVWIYMVASLVASLGVSYFNMVIWANITDVIDDQEVKTGTRDDGVIYSIYSFARKVGQALAGGASGWALTAIGYDELAKVQTNAVKEGIYSVVNLVPGICFFIVAAILMFGYPLTKKKVEENAAILKKKRG